MLRFARVAVRPASARVFSTNARDINMAQKSYRPKGYEVSDGFRRARQQYAVRNFVLFSALSAFAIGVFAYTILNVRACLTRLIRTTFQILKACV